MDSPTSPPDRNRPAVATNHHQRKGWSLLPQRADFLSDCTAQAACQVGLVAFANHWRHKRWHDPSAPKPRRSACLAAARSWLLPQLKPVHLQPNSLATFKRCYSRARTPRIWNDLIKRPTLQQQHVQGYLFLRR